MPTAYNLFFQLLFFFLFPKTSDTASKLAKYMTDNVGLDVGLLLSGELEIQQFISVIDRSRVGKDRILITTNVRGRGIDDIEQVLKY